ncbi:hypothetical protein CK203_057191 [Vitis vinifera]|uniref:Uncharacterized protein n=1 Tax=Vitis vinifera TaxID=29760 RepID=A0A438GKZ1_VITVI|nr:hypothetical protein CK203_057191 [Vitis vinifera]
MMWSSTLTTSSTISLPLRLRSTFQQLLNVVARATWYDGSHGYKDFKRKWSRTRLLFFLQKHHLKKGDQSLEIKFLKSTTMAGGVQQAAIQAPYQRRSGAACSVITKSSSSHSGALVALLRRHWRHHWKRHSGVVLGAVQALFAAPFQASFSCRQEAPLEAPFRRHLIQMGSATECRCRRQEGTPGVDAEHAGRGVHGAVRVGAVHADGVKIGFWSISDIRCEVPELRGDNFKIWKERILLQLGCMDKDYAIRKDEPHKITDTSIPEEIILYKRWEKSNRLSMIQSLGKHPDYEVHIPEAHMYKRCMRTHHGNEDIVAQLKKLEVEMSEFFLVHFILNTLLPQYGPFKISYNTHKDKWFINELMTMCVQEEGRLLMEQRSAMLVTQRKRKKGKSQASKKREATNSSQI